MTDERIHFFNPEKWRPSRYICKVMGHNYEDGYVFMDHDEVMGDDPGDTTDVCTRCFDIQDYSWKDIERWEMKDGTL